MQARPFIKPLWVESFWASKSRMPRNRGKHVCTCLVFDELNRMSFCYMYISKKFIQKIQGTIIDQVIFVSAYQSQHSNIFSEMNPCSFNECAASLSMQLIYNCIFRIESNAYLKIQCQHMYFNAAIIHIYKNLCKIITPPFMLLLFIMIILQN